MYKTQSPSSDSPGETRPPSAHPPAKGTLCEALPFPTHTSQVLLTAHAHIICFLAGSEVEKKHLLAEKP